MKQVKYLINLISTLLKKLIYRNTILGYTNSINCNSFIYDSTIGKYNYFGPGTVINNTNIKNYCSFAPNVIIGGMEHDYSKFSTSTKLFSPHKRKTTTIEDDVWVGANAFIRAGIVVGKGSIIGSNAVVLKDVPPMSIVVGNPARVIKSRFQDKSIINKYLKIDFNNSPNEIHSKLET